MPRGGKTARSSPRLGTRVKPPCAHPGSREQGESLPVAHQSRGQGFFRPCSPWWIPLAAGREGMQITWVFQLRRFPFHNCLLAPFINYAFAITLLINATTYKALSRCCFYLLYYISFDPTSRWLHRSKISQPCTRISHLPGLLIRRGVGPGICCTAVLSQSSCASILPFT